MIVLPKGFSFRVSPEINNRVNVYLERTVRLHTKVVGNICLVRHNRVSFETHSWLAEKFHGKGLGTLLYAKAIQWCLDNGYKVRSSGTTLEAAQRVWRGKGLRKYFTILTHKDGTNHHFDMFYAVAKRSK